MRAITATAQPSLLQDVPIALRFVSYQQGVNVLQESFDEAWDGGFYRLTERQTRLVVLQFYGVNPKF